MIQDKDEDASVAKVVAEAEAIKKLLEESLEEEDEDYKLDDLKARYADLKRQNEELEACVEEALQEAHKLKEENQKLSDAHNHALLQLQLQEADSLEARSLVIENHEKELLEQKLVETAVQVEELTNQLKILETENDDLVVKVQEHRKKAVESQREADKSRRRVVALEEEVTRLGLLKVEIRRLKAFEESAQEVEKLRSELEQLRQVSSRPSTSDAEQPAPKPASTQEPAAAAAAPVAAVVPKPKGPFQPGQLEDVRAACAAVATGLETQQCPDELRNTVQALLEHTVALDSGYEVVLQERDKARTELAEFSRPSAWAKRDQQYSLDKQRWEQEAQSFKERIASLKAENQVFREANKTAEYELRIQDLNKRIQQLEDDKTAALHEVHELKLQLVPISGTFVSDNAKEDRLGEDDTESLSASIHTVPSTAPPSKQESLVNPMRAYSSAPSHQTSDDAVHRVSDTLQHLRDKGLDSGTLHSALHYYAAPAMAGSAAAEDLPGAHASEDVVNSQDFQQVLHWLQQAGVGPEHVSSFLNRQKEINSKNPSPLHSRDPSSLAETTSQDAAASSSAAQAPPTPATTSAAGAEASAAPSPPSMRVLDAVNHFKGDGYAPVELQRYFTLYSSLHTMHAAGAQAGAQSPVEVKLLQSPRFNAVLQYLEQHGVGPDEVLSVFPAADGPPQGTAQQGAAHASWRSSQEDVLGLATFGQVVNYFASLGLPPAKLQLGMGAYVRRHVLGYSDVSSEDEEGSPTDIRRIISHLESQQVDPTAVAQHVLNGCMAQQHIAAMLPLLQDAGDAAAVTAALQRYAAGSGDLPPNYELTASLLRTHGVNVEQVDALLRSNSSSSSVSACMADLEQHGLAGTEVLELLRVHRAVTVLEGQGGSSDVDERVASICKQQAVQPEQALQWLLDAGTAGDEAGLSQADMVQLFWVQQAAATYQAGSQTPGAAQATSRQDSQVNLVSAFDAHPVDDVDVIAAVGPVPAHAGRETVASLQAAPTLSDDAILPAPALVPAGNTGPAAAAVGGAVEAAGASVADTDFSWPVLPEAGTATPRPDGQLPAPGDVGSAPTTTSGSAVAQGTGGCFSTEQLEQLRDNPAQLAEALARPDLAASERQALQLLQEAVQLQAKVEVLQHQVMKMQTQVARADDVSFQIEDEIDAALAQTSGNTSEVLVDLRGKVQHLRLEAQLTKSMPASPMQASSPLAGPLDSELASMLDDKICRLKQRLRISSEKKQVEGLERATSVHEYLQSLSEIEAEAARLRDENHVLMQQLVTKKIEYAELQEENMVTKRALVRAKEKQAQLSKKIDDIRDMPSLTGSATAATADVGSPTATTTAKRRIAMFRAGRSWMTPANGTS